MGGGKKSRHAKSSGVKQTSSQNDKESLDPADGARNQLEAVAECPAAAPTAAAAAAQEEPQTYPPCTVQMEAQFAFALSNDKIKHQLQRLFDSVHKSLLVAPGADTSGFLDTVQAKVSEGAADQEIYQALRLLVHPDKDASPPVEESSTLDRARARDRAQERCTKALCMLRASPEWGQRRPTAILDVGCGRDVFFAAALGEALQCESFAVDVAWDPTDVPKLPRLTYSRIDSAVPYPPLPFPDGSLDVVSVMMVMHHVRGVEGLMAEVQRILKPGGVLLLREHDCDIPELGVIIDLEHGLHQLVWPSGGHGQSPSVQNFIAEHWAHYRSKETWRALLAAHNLCLVDSCLDWIDSVDRTYYDLYQKPASKPIAYTLRLPVEPPGSTWTLARDVHVEPLLLNLSCRSIVQRCLDFLPPFNVERLKVGVIPYDASGALLRSYLYRFANGENWIKRLPKPNRLFGGDKLSIIPRPVILLLLGQVGDAFEVRLVPAVATGIELPPTLAGRLFDTKEAAERLCQHTLPAEWAAGAIEIITRPFADGGRAALMANLRGMLVRARELKAVLLFDKFAQTPLHKMWASLLDELEWDLPVVCLCREMEADFLPRGKGNVEAERPKYMWAAPGPEAALLLRPERSGTERINSQPFEQDVLNEAVTHCLVTSGARVGAELPLLLEIAHMLAGHQPAQTQDGIPTRPRFSGPPSAPAEHVGDTQPVVALLINGGDTMLKAASLAAVYAVPVVALHKTGRLADVTALALMKDAPNFELGQLTEWLTGQLRPRLARGGPAFTKPESIELLRTFLGGRVITVDSEADSPEDFGAMVHALLSKMSGAGEALQLKAHRTPFERSALLAKLPVKWVSAQYVLSLRGRMPRHQDVPLQGFVPMPQADTVDQLAVAISHPWLERAHPDNADGFKLLLLQSRLRTLGVRDDTPIFIEYAANSTHRPFAC